MPDAPSKRVVLVAAFLGLGFAAVVGGAIGEVAVRLVRPQQLIQPRSDIFIPADTVGWDLRPNVATTVNTGERTVSWRTDSAGFRIGREGRHAAPRSLLLIGDSFLQALQVEWEQSAAGLLDAQLHRTSPAVAVRNAGVSAWDPPQYAARLRRALSSGNRPSAVIVSWYVGNDATGDAPAYLPPRPVMTSARLRWPASFAWRDVVDAWLRPWNDLLKQHSHLYVLVRQAMLGVRMRAGLSADAVPTEILVREASSPRWASSAAWGDTLVRLARAANVPIGFVLVPSTYQVHDAAFDLYAAGNGFTRSAVDLDQPNRKMAEALGTLGVPVVDALPEFRRAAAASPRLLYGTVDRHLSPEGNVVFARVLASMATRLLDGDPSVAAGVASPHRR